jgi:hypothetical protein
MVMDSYPDQIDVLEGKMKEAGEALLNSVRLAARGRVDDDENYRQHLAGYLQGLSVMMEVMITCVNSVRYYSNRE